MTDFSAGFKKEIREQKDWTGIHAFKVVDAVESVSQSSGMPMIVITTIQSESEIKNYSYIVKNDYFNANMTEFFNSLEGVEFGDFDFSHWIGQCGVARYGRDKDGYLKLKRFIAYDNDAAMDCEPFVEKSKPQQSTAPSPADDLPF